MLYPKKSRAVFIQDFFLAGARGRILAEVHDIYDTVICFENQGWDMSSLVLVCQHDMETEGRSAEGSTICTVGVKQKIINDRTRFYRQPIHTARGALSVLQRKKSISRTTP